LYSSESTYSSFNSNWKAILEKSERLFLDADLFNIIDYLIEDSSVKKFGAYPKYEQTLFIKLTEMLDEEDNCI